MAELAHHVQDPHNLPRIPRRTSVLSGATGWLMFLPYRTSDDGLHQWHGCSAFWPVLMAENSEAAGSVDRASRARRQSSSVDA
jgi:hypothetical protein